MGEGGGVNRCGAGVRLEVGAAAEAAAAVGAAAGDEWRCVWTSAQGGGVRRRGGGRAERAEGGSACAALTR